jgi:small-conductance mechanosensitive channel/CRP-like cAMP-binding protein
LSGPFRLALPLLVAIVVLAAIFRVVPNAPRRRQRRSVVLYAGYLALLGVRELVTLVGEFPRLSTGFDVATETLEVLLIINLSALAIFDLLFYRVFRWDYPDILHDLTVGASYLVAFGWVLHRVGVDFTSIVATSAVVTAVIGLSLQTTLGNVFGGIALQLDDSIQEGDWVELESKVQGQVKQVRWRHTVIETRDWDTLIVPNSQLLAQTIKVLGKRDGLPAVHRMTVNFSVDFRYPPARVVEVVNEALESASITRVATHPKPHCICFDLSRDQKDSFAYYGVRYWLTDLAVDDGTNSLVRERIYIALRRAEIPLALPAATVFISQDDPDHAARKRTREVASRVEALENVALFSRLSQEERAHLAERARPAPFSDGEVITRQGAPAHWLYVLTRGEAEVRTAGADGVDCKVADLKAPSYFGEMALMTGASREATVIAKTDVDCLRVDKDDFRDILEKRPEIAQEMSTLLAQRRVELVAIRDHLDAEAKKRKMVTERGRILESIRDFFGLNDGP